MMTGVLRPRERTTVSPYFPVGGPVAAADLVGREPYLRRLVDRLEDGNHVIVAGPRRGGENPVIPRGRCRVKRPRGPTPGIHCPPPPRPPPPRGTLAPPGPP